MRLNAADIEFDGPSSSVEKLVLNQALQRTREKVNRSVHENRKNTCKRKLHSCMHGCH